MKYLGFALTLAPLLVGCGLTGETQRFPLPVTEPTQSVRVAVGSVEVTEVSLPLYAESEEIAMQQASGAITTDTKVLWADDPRRSVTQAIVTNLTAATRARVASEPWPFDEFPDVRVTVRFDRFLPAADGRFRVSGQYYVARVNSGLRESAQSFDLAVPYQPGSPVSLSAAQASALRDLSVIIATTSLR